MQQGETVVKELKASQEKAISQASELHVKEVEELRSQADKLKQELSSSKERTQELEKLVSELQSYKEQVQVSTYKWLVWCVNLGDDNKAVRYNEILR